MKGLKHDRTGFFIWLYYPSTRHTRYNIEEFFRRIYSNESSITDSRIDAYLLQGALNIQRIHDATENEDWIHMVVNGVGTSAFPDGKETWGVQFDRHGMVSLILMDYNSYIDHDSQRSVRMWFNDVDAIIDHFRPVYGFGRIQFNKWVNAFPRLPPPETRIWPYNLFNTKAYLPELVPRLEGFIEDNSTGWLLRYIGKDMVELRVRDLRTKESDIGPEVTRAILGEGDDLLTPTVGYPPPERWWD